MKTKKLYFRRKIFSNSGFTLIELMVVIALIAILAVGGYSAYIASLKRGRDVRRKQDMKAIQNAFEQYYATNLDYPINDSEAAGTMMDGFLPTDPKTSDSYTYTYSYADDGFSYCVCSLLENAGEGNADTAACNFFSGGDYFCVQNLQ